MGSLGPQRPAGAARGYLPNGIGLGALLLEAARLAGFAMGVVCEELYGDGRPFMVVEDLIVDRQARRRGIGRALMEALEDAARRRDCCQIILVTETARVDARRFYDNLGYAGEAHTGFKKRLG